MKKTNKSKVEKFIRVDHAGERGAIKIYEGQLLALNTFIKDENLKKIIDKSKFEYKEIKTFYFYPSNRVDIKTKDGILIKLPLINLSEALRVANLIKKDDKFKNNKILDLRIANHIITSNE